MYKFLCSHVFISLDMCLEVELLGQMVALCSMLLKNFYTIFKMDALFYIPSGRQSMEVLVSSYLPQHFCYLWCVIMAVLVCMDGISAWF
jgi:hypothetical protein